MLIRLTLASLLIGSVALAAPPDENAVKEERKKLEGLWVVESATSNGQKLEREKGCLYVFADDNLTRNWLDGMEKKGMYAVNPTARPCTIDIEDVKAGPQPAKWIYELNGDSLKLCYGRAERRPAVLSDRGQTVLVLKRRPWAVGRAFPHHADLRQPPAATSVLPFGDIPAPPYLCVTVHFAKPPGDRVVPLVENPSLTSVRTAVSDHTGEIVARWSGWQVKPAEFKVEAGVNLKRFRLEAQDGKVASEFTAYFCAITAVWQPKSQTWHVIPAGAERVLVFPWPNKDARGRPAPVPSGKYFLVGPDNERVALNALQPPRP